MTRILISSTIGILIGMGVVSVFFYLDIGVGALPAFLIGAISTLIVMRICGVRL